METSIKPLVLADVSRRPTVLQVHRSREFSTIACVVFLGACVSHAQVNALEHVPWYTRTREPPIRASLSRRMASFAIVVTCSHQESDQGKVF